MKSQSQRKILIVDDESAARKLLSRILSEEGYVCTVAKDAVTAKQALLNDSFDLLLTDLMMPGESGLSLIKHVKKNYPAIGRVMITAISSLDIAREILDVGVYGYIVKPISRDTVLITISNAIRHLELDHHMQACVREMTENITKRTDQLDTIMDSVNIGIVMIDHDRKVLQINRKMQEWCAHTPSDTQSFCCHFYLEPEELQKCKTCQLTVSLQQGVTVDKQKQFTTPLGQRDFRVITTPILDRNNKVTAAIGLYEDITEELKIVQDLHQAQKLEAVGQLAAGIAHEINTPVQYIGDNLNFIKDSMEDIQGVLTTFTEAFGESGQDDHVAPEIRSKLAKMIEDADLDYLLEEIPLTIDQSLAGIKRVGEIVKAMKDFSHPGEDEKTNNDINKIISTTLMVCKNEWKYVAELETDLAENLPFIPCYPGDLGQAFLNIIVNGAHAIGEITENGNKGMGKITIRTILKEEYLEIQIQDTGGGIKKKNQDQVFNHFFTTKARGKGTGQGLTIAHRVVVDRHGGEINFETEEGKGTTFIIRLPLN